MTVHKNFYSIVYIVLYTIVFPQCFDVVSRVAGRTSGL